MLFLPTSLSLTLCFGPTPAVKHSLLNLKFHGLSNAHLAAKAEDKGWSVMIRSVEVGYRGFVASIVKLLKELGIRGQEQRKNLLQLLRK